MFIFEYSLIQDWNWEIKYGPLRGRERFIAVDQREVLLVVKAIIDSDWTWETKLNILRKTEGSR